MTKLQTVTVFSTKKDSTTAPTNGQVLPTPSLETVSPSYDGLSFAPSPLGTKLTGIKQDVFLDRYSLRDKNGKVTENFPEQMWRRVAWGLSQSETSPQSRQEWEEKFYQLLSDFKFVPGGRILSGAGSGYQVTSYNCYVIPSPADSRHGIMDNITKTVEIQARGGGVGINMSSLRPRGARVKKVNGTSSGPVNWASLYSTANYDVIQQGGSRRGALMLMLNDWHPDIKEFISVKEDLTKIPGANLSVCVSDTFMEKVMQDADWPLVFPDLDDPDYDKVWNGDIAYWQSLHKPVKTYETIKARELWYHIAKSAWRCGEPGLMFIDRYNKLSNTYYFEKIIATNPCGEQGLGAWGVCNLGSINLASYVKNKTLDLDSLAKDTKVAVRLLDNTIEANYYFFDDIRETQMKIRRVGLGTMGLADTFIKMEVRYGSPESLTLIDTIYSTIRNAAYEASVELAKEKGPFGGFDKDKYLQGQFIQKLPQTIKDGIAKYGIRNAVILSQAPTGTISILAGTSSGIEPIFEFAFKRKDRTGEHIVYHDLYQDWLNSHSGKTPPGFFVTARELTPEEHITVQAAIQKYTDSSISKTVNAPETHTIEDVERLYSLAYKLGCKGIAYFRENSRQGVLTALKDTDKTPKAAPVEDHVITDRPLKVNGATYKIETPLGNAFITVNHTEDGNPFEVFITIGKAGSEVAAMAEALGRLISTTLRFSNHVSGIDKIKEIVNQLQGIGGGRSVGFGPNRVRSLPDAVAKAIAMHFGLLGSVNSTLKLSSPLQPSLLEDSSQVNGQTRLPIQASADFCPECKEAAFVYEEGCKKCHACGYSEC